MLNKRLIQQLTLQHQHQIHLLISNNFVVPNQIIVILVIHLILVVIV